MNEETDLRIICGDALTEMRKLPTESVNCVATSPPFWGLRDYKTEPQVWDETVECEHEWGNWAESQKHSAGAFCHCGAWRGSLGLEPNPELFVQHIVQVFREARRVLRRDGTLWLNMGDCYATGAGKVGVRPGGGKQGDRWAGYRGAHDDSLKHRPGAIGPVTQPNRMPILGLKPKDLVGMPWRVAFALQADGWYLRSEIIWNKPNCMPESVRDRPTRAHEQIFLLTKSQKYWYDADAIKEPATGNAHNRGNGVGPKMVGANSRICQDRDPSHPSVRKIKNNASFSAAVRGIVEARNKRTVWTIPTQPTPEAHFATFPEDLVKPCILAGCPDGGTVLDPFGGAGTTGKVAIEFARKAILIDLNPEYVKLIEKRCSVVQRRLRTA